MTTDHPAPLTPADCDLRGMPYMPLDIVRLFDSDLYALSTGDEFKAALTLWGKAFLQVPAGSLPTDDRLLAHLSGTGARWSKVKAMALRGWVLCADGRLYHPVVAEKALEAWEARLAQRARTEAARAAKAARKNNQGSAKPGPTGADTGSVTDLLTDAATSSVTDAATGSKGEGREGKGIEEEKPPSLPSEARSPRASRLPPDWQPGPDGERYATEQGLNPARVAANFRDYWHAKPGQGGLKLDWMATWRTWCRRDAERRAPSQQPRQPEQEFRNGFFALAQELFDEHGQPIDDQPRHRAIGGHHVRH